MITGGLPTPVQRGGTLDGTSRQAEIRSGSSTVEDRLVRGAGACRAPASAKGGWWWGSEGGVAQIVMLAAAASEAMEEGRRRLRCGVQGGFWGCSKILHTPPGVVALAHLALCPSFSLVCNKFLVQHVHYHVSGNTGLKPDGSCVTTRVNYSGNSLGSHGSPPTQTRSKWLCGMFGSFSNFRWRSATLT